MSDKRRRMTPATTTRFESLEDRLVLSASTWGCESEVFRQALEALLDPQVPTPDLTEMTDSTERVVYHYLNPGGIELSGRDLWELQMFGPGETHISFFSNYAIELIHSIDPTMLPPGVYENSLVNEIWCGCNGGNKTSGETTQSDGERDESRELAVISQIESAQAELLAAGESFVEFSQEETAWYSFSAPGLDSTALGLHDGAPGAMFPAALDLIDGLHDTTLLGSDNRFSPSLTTTPANLQIDKLFENFDDAHSPL